MAMMASKSGSIYFPSGYTVWEKHPILPLKPPISPVLKAEHSIPPATQTNYAVLSEKFEIKKNYPYKYFFYLIVHEQLIDYSSTIAFIETFVKFGELIGDNGWISIPMGEGFKKFREQLAGLMFKPEVVEYIKRTPDVTLLIHEYPMDIYKHYPNEEITPTLLLTFPKIESSHEKYIGVLSRLTFVINNNVDLFNLFKNNFGKTNDIVDCLSFFSSDTLAKKNNYTKSYSKEYSSIYKENIQKTNFVILMSDLIKKEAIIPERIKQEEVKKALEKLNKNVKLNTPISNETDNSREKNLFTSQSENKKKKWKSILIKIGGVTAGIITLLGSLAEALGLLNLL